MANGSSCSVAPGLLLLFFFWCTARPFLSFAYPDVDTFEFRGSQRVDIRRNTNANSPVGIYRCDIPTNDVHDANDTSV